MIKYDVVYSDDAKEDLRQIKEYLCFNESLDVAEYVISKIDNDATTLKHFPQRCGHPHELLRCRIKRYREKLSNPYRIIYEIDGTEVIVVAIIHASRNAEPIFKERFL